VAEPLNIELPTTVIEQVQRLLNKSAAPHNK
nr:lincosamide nucleotidyltransferase Lnu(F) [Deltaproteobacteria bacterium]